MTQSLETVPTDPSAYRCWRDIQVRFRDLDAMGHVNNAVFVTYLELGREAYVHVLDAPQLTSEAQGMSERFPFILAELSCRFLRPIQLEDRPRVGIRVERFGTKSWDFSYLIAPAAPEATSPRAPHTGGDHPSQRPFAVARSTQVTFDYRAGRSIPVPDWLVAAVERYEGRVLRTPV